MFDAYFQEIKKLLASIEHDEKEAIKLAAVKIAECIQNDGIVHVFGCGHSHMFAEEVFYRSGGLAAINPILIEDLMLHHGAVRSSEMENKHNFAYEFMAHTTIQQKDVVIVVSTSGRNPVPIDVAMIAKKQGAFVIAITSLNYAKTQKSRHQSGKFLSQAVDLSINNHIEVGDALMRHDLVSVPFGSASSVIGLAIMNGIMIEAIQIMAENDFDPPIFKSNNIDGAKEHNQQLINKYKDRIPYV